MSTAAGHALLEAIAEEATITLRIEDLAPTRALEILAEGGQSHRVTLEQGSVRLTIEVGNGLVVGATASADGGPLEGREAYEMLRGVESGELRIEPLRFPSLANLLVPLSALPDVTSAGIALPDPTVQIKLPEAARLPDAPTVELELSSDVIALDEVIASAPPPPPAASLPPVTAKLPTSRPTASAPPMASLPPRPPSAPPSAASAAETSPLTPPPSSPPPARARSLATRLLPVGAAATLALGLAVGTMVWASQGEAAQAPGRITAVSDVQIAPTPEPVEAEPVEESSADRRQRARALARQARQALRDGRSGEAVTLARDAARLRGGLPYYQTLLGDALRRDGRRAGAIRAYRRALRLRPGYAPAERRLERIERRARRRARGRQHT